MVYCYHPTGVCCQEIWIDLSDDGETLNCVKFIGGCPGNQLGISKLIEGKKVDDIVSILSGTQCGIKSTSCPDQLCRGLAKVKEELGKKKQD